MYQGSHPSIFGTMYVFKLGLTDACLLARRLWRLVRSTRLYPEEAFARKPSGRIRGAPLTALTLRAAYRPVGDFRHTLPAYHRKTDRGFVARLLTERWVRPQNSAHTSVKPLG